MELKKIAEKYTETDKFKDITFLAQMSLTVPVRNAWHERGTSAAKRGKSRTRSNIKIDSFITIRPVTTKFDKQVHLQKVTSSRQDHMTNKKLCLQCRNAYGH